MLKNIKDLSNLIKLDNQLNSKKDEFDNIFFNILKIIKEESGLNIKEKDISIKKNILKIKSNSNVRFIILLHLENINKKIKDLNSDFILEL